MSPAPLPTLSRLARALPAVWLRVDSLEAALVRSGLVADQWDLGPAGYFAAHALALDNLKTGLSVVADSVNPLQVTRAAWQDAALTAGSLFLNVEVVCSDPAEHRARVETRQVAIEGLRPPTWAEVMEREYEPWTVDRLILDTAALTPGQAVGLILERVARLRPAAGRKQTKRPQGTPS